PNGRRPAPSHAHGSPPALDCRPPLRASPRRRPRVVETTTKGRDQRGGGPPCVRPPQDLLLASPTPGVHPGASWMQPEPAHPTVCALARLPLHVSHPKSGALQEVCRDMSPRHLARRPPAPHRRSAHGRRATQEHGAARSAHEHPHPDLPVRGGRRGGGRRWTCSTTRSCFRSRCFGKRSGMRMGMRTHTVLSTQAMRRREVGGRG
ncbi:hypothetical protein B0H13DRAFT_2112858, partial [Mycena leptocephala]